MAWARSTSVGAGPEALDARRYTSARSDVMTNPAPEPNSVAVGVDPRPEFVTTPMRLPGSASAGRSPRRCTVPAPTITASAYSRNVRSTSRSFAVAEAAGQPVDGDAAVEARDHAQSDPGVGRGEADALDVVGLPDRWSAATGAGQDAAGSAGRSVARRQSVEHASPAAGDRADVSEPRAGVVGNSVPVHSGVHRKIPQFTPLSPSVPQGVTRRVFTRAGGGATHGRPSRPVRTLGGLGTTGPGRMGSSEIPEPVCRATLGHGPSPAG